MSMAEPATATGHGGDVPIKGRSIGSIMRLKYRRNRLAMIGLWTLIVLYALAMFCEFFAPYTLDDSAKGFENHPPMRIRFFDLDGRFHLQPFVYGATRTLDMTTFKTHWTPNPDERFPIHLFVRGANDYPVLGFLPVRSNLRFFGVKEGRIFLLGTDKWGRDMFSRILYGGRVSLTIGWVGVMISLVLGILIGALSGYFAGVVDLVVQRVIEVLISVPSLPLWILLASALPKEWTPLQSLLRPGRDPVVHRLDRPGAGGARHDPLAPRDPVHPGGAQHRRRHRAHHGAAPGAQHLQLPAGEPHPGHPRHDPGRDQPELPGAGHPAHP